MTLGNLQLSSVMWFSRSFLSGMSNSSSFALWRRYWISSFILWGYNVENVIVKWLPWILTKSPDLELKDSKMPNILTAFLFGYTWGWGREQRTTLCNKPGLPLYYCVEKRQISAWLPAAHMHLFVYKSYKYYRAHYWEWEQETKLQYPLTNNHCFIKLCGKDCAEQKIVVI